MVAEGRLSLDADDRHTSIPYSMQYPIDLYHGGSKSRCISIWEGLFKQRPLTISEGWFKTIHGSASVLGKGKEVQTGVQVLRDKQEIAEAHLELAKLQLSTKADHLQSESSLEPSELQQKQQYQHQQAHPPQPQQSMQQAPQLSAITPQPPPPPPPLPAPNAPPPPPPPLPQQSQLPVPYAAQLPLQHQIPSIPSLPEQQYSKPSHQLTQYTPPGQPNEPIHQQQQYQMPPSHPQPQHGLPQSQLYQSPPQVPQYSQPIQPEEPNTYMPPSQSYLPNIRQPSPQSPTGPPLHQYYGSNPPLYELPPANRPSSGNLPISSSYGGPGLSEPYIYGNSPSHYNSKPSPFSSAPPTSGGSGSYQRLPTAKLLPQAASVGSNPSGGGPTGNRVAVDDVVDKVATMGFSREQVRATVRKLTENGQSVDLNVVLDKLMNDGEVHQPAKGWESMAVDVRRHLMTDVKLEDRRNSTKPLTASTHLLLSPPVFGDDKPGFN
ncbi:hypothetical protein MA16_Dca021130 [Dendrobium catenatum]|uniref:DUF1421 domain-containing protein n=1 Tax=Dendrobium catenatum TaxID=906689 RepID=A0A2I0VHW1_9ASPA|nr:hypothetical protein MA16_Dca021130 [Dendrobium catenatum]